MHNPQTPGRLQPEGSVETCKLIAPTLIHAYVDTLRELRKRLHRAKAVNAEVALHAIAADIQTVEQLLSQLMPKWPHG